MIKSEVKMKNLVLLLCLGLTAGCATIGPVAQKPPQKIKPGQVVDSAQIESAISVFSRAIESNPDYAGAYYNRAKAYYYIKDYEKSWQDVHKAESLGLKFNLEFIEKLEKASGQ